MNEERNAEIARLRRDERWSYPEIGRKFGICSQRAQQICKRLGVENSRFDPLTPRLRASVRRMVLAEVRGDQIIESIVAAHPHVAANSVRRAIHDFTTERRMATRERAKRLYLEHKSTYKVAAALGVTHTAAWYMLKDTGLLAPQHSGHSKQLRDRALKLMRTHSLAEVSRRLGVDKKTLSAWRRGRWTGKKSTAGVPAQIVRQKECNVRGKARRRQRSVAVLEQERARIDRAMAALDVVADRD